MASGMRHVATQAMNLKGVVGIVNMATIRPKAGIAGAETGIGPGILVGMEAAM